MLRAVLWQFSTNPLQRDSEIACLALLFAFHFLQHHRGVFAHIYDRDLDQQIKKIWYPTRTTSPAYSGLRAKCHPLLKNTNCFEYIPWCWFQFHLQKTWRLSKNSLKAVYQKGKQIIRKSYLWTVKELIYIPLLRVMNRSI